MACWLYEGMLLFGVTFIAAYLFSALSQSRHGLANRLGLQIFVGLVLALYFTWFWHKGQTLAMKTWRIRVLDQHGMALTQTLALKRFVLSCLWFAPPLLLAGPFAGDDDPGRVRGLGDHLGLVVAICTSAPVLARCMGGHAIGS
jgi:uncharacterized RDD family membrane protein YckC